MEAFTKTVFTGSPDCKIFMDKASKGETIEVYGSPDIMKALLYVKDLDLGIRNALEFPSSKGFYNKGYEQNFRLIDVVNVIVAVFSNNGAVSTITQRPDIPNNGGFPLMDVTKPIRDIGLEPRYSNIVDMMKDYKYELERGLYTRLFNVQP